MDVSTKGSTQQLSAAQHHALTSSYLGTRREEKKRAVRPSTACNIPAVLQWAVLNVSAPAFAFANQH